MTHSREAARFAADPNYWLDADCARAFWDQHQALPYQELLHDTAQSLQPGLGERWLDLGCGAGQLTAVIWQRSQGQVGEILAVDCNTVNGAAIAKLQRRLLPRPLPEQIRFETVNFSHGLPQFAEAQFDGIVSGLALSYAESKDPATGRYTDFAYNRLLAELYRVLRPGGQLVFSVNVAQPRFWRIFWKSLRVGLRVSNPGKLLVNGLRMQLYGRWLCREARRGRFHFLPIQEIGDRLELAGFHAWQYRLSYAGQAYLLSVRKNALPQCRSA